VTRVTGPLALSDFEPEALYARDQWYVHEVLSIDPVAREVTARIDTERLGPIAAAQRPHPGHEPHLPGAIAIQVTGTLGNLHAVYLVGLRPSEGWVGYGTKIASARFHKLGRLGPPIVARLSEHRKRQFRGAWFFDYRFRFEQEEGVVFESEQTAVWQQQARSLPADGDRS
jgi:hypothetical protein